MVFIFHSVISYFLYFLIVYKFRAKRKKFKPTKLPKILSFLVRFFNCLEVKSFCAFFVLWLFLVVLPFSFLNNLELVKKLSKSLGHMSGQLYKADTSPVLTLTSTLDVCSTLNSILKRHANIEKNKAPRCWE